MAAPERVSAEDTMDAPDPHPEVQQERRGEPLQEVGGWADGQGPEDPKPWDRLPTRLEAEGEEDNRPEHVKDLERKMLYRDQQNAAAQERLNDEAATRDIRDAVEASRARGVARRVAADKASRAPVRRSEGAPRKGAEFGDLVAEQRAEQQTEGAHLAGRLERAKAALSTARAQRRPDDRESARRVELAEDAVKDLEQKLERIKRSA